MPADDDMSGHQYLISMQNRGGGYAILMAFHVERRRRGTDFKGPLHKDEIISLGQVQFVPVKTNHPACKRPVPPQRTAPSCSACMRFFPKMDAWPSGCLPRAKPRLQHHAGWLTRSRI